VIATSTRTIRVAHSPDADDAFMFHALSTGQLDTGDLCFEHRLADIESLNQAAQRGLYEVSALSIHAYATVADRYWLMSSGASMGEGYGPKVVSARPLERESLVGRRVAIPGLLTTAYLAARLWLGDFEAVVVRYDRIADAVLAGEVDAGVVIHELQLDYATRGLFEVQDLGRWWLEETGLPLPLGGNVVRRDLGWDLARRIDDLVRASVRHALANREPALDHALVYASGLSRADAGRFVGMYVNARTVDYGPDGRAAVHLLLARARREGWLAQDPAVAFLDA